MQCKKIPTDPENSDSALFRDIRGIMVIPMTASQRPREDECGERAFYQTFWYFFFVIVLIFFYSFSVFSVSYHVFVF